MHRHIYGTMLRCSERPPLGVSGGIHVGATRPGILCGDDLARAPARVDVATSKTSKAARNIISGADFQTEAAAKLAGEKALIEFLHRLAEEDRNVL